MFYPYVHAQELQAADVGHIMPPAATANFGVAAVAAIHEPLADTAAETARPPTGSSRLASPPVDDANAADPEQLGASAYQSSNNDSDVGMEGLAAAPPAEALPPGTQPGSTAGSTPQHTAPAAGSEPQRPTVRGTLHAWQAGAC